MATRKRTSVGTIVFWKFALPILAAVIGLAMMLAVTYWCTVCQ